MYNNNNYPSIDVIRSKMDQVMVVPELSLGPSMSIDQKSTTSSSLTSDQSTETARSLKKRKSFNDHIVQSNNKPVVARRSHDDFFLRDSQVKRDRLPLDWEQCLDLKSGKIYFLNRKTAEKVWDRHSTTDDHQQQNKEKPILELELNISSPTSSSTHCSNSSFKLSQKTSSLNDQQKPTYNSTGQHSHPIKVISDHHSRTATTTTTIPTTTTTTSCVVGSNTNNMVALACSNCHLLVILSKSSPSCPNCKYVHYLHSTDEQHDFKASPTRNMKPISTLSLFS